MVEDQASGTERLREQWHKWGTGPNHRYVRLASEDYVEGECCAVCGALPTAPWHLPERRQTS